MPAVYAETSTWRRHAAAWAIGIAALAIVAAILILAEQIHTVTARDSLGVGISLLVIVLGSLGALALSFRFSRFLESRVAARTRELSESHERLITTLDSLDAAVCVADLATHEVPFVNRVARRLLGEGAQKTCCQTLRSDQSGPCETCPAKGLLDAHGEPTGVHIWENRPRTGPQLQHRAAARRGHPRPKRGGPRVHLHHLHPAARAQSRSVAGADQAHRPGLEVVPEHRRIPRGQGTVVGPRVHEAPRIHEKSRGRIRNANRQHGPRRVASQHDVEGVLRRLHQ